jgi:hypothetical protein
MSPGQSDLQTEHGPEYRVVTRAYEIAPGATGQEKIELERRINMNARGWYSGDLHNHCSGAKCPGVFTAGLQPAGFAGNVAHGAEVDLCYARSPWRLAGKVVT